MIKKQLIIISVFVMIVSIFVSCSVNSSSEDVSTTAVTDSNGTTHYYEPLTENESTSVYAEIVTDDKGKAVTKKNGTYVTNEHTTVLPIERLTDNTSSATVKSSSDITKDIDDADNVVVFEHTETTEKTKPDNTTTTEKQTTTTETTTQKDIQPATDKDGWINKWY